MVHLFTTFALMATELTTSKITNTLQQRRKMGGREETKNIFYIVFLVNIERQ